MWLQWFQTPPDRGNSSKGENNDRIALGLCVSNPFRAGQVHAELDHQVTLSERYLVMLRNRQASAFDPWTQDAQASPTKEIRQFVHNLRNDEAANRAALEHTWSNGQVEGQVHRLKVIKRSMYGRAKFDLLRLRVLYAT